MIGKQEIYVDITQQALDDYLSRGWFRMGQRMFTTHYLFLDEVFFSAIWLRYRLDPELMPVLTKKLNKLNRLVQIHEADWENNREQEALYEVYAAHSGLQLSPTLQHLLMGNRKQNAFNSRQVCFYQQNRLVALGIFDAGLQSSAGIINCFHPDLRQYSPGKSLMYAKMLSCMEAGMAYFYPGYAVPGHARFHYKLQIAPAFTEWYHPVKQCWLPYEPQHPLPDWLMLQYNKLKYLQHTLQLCGIAGRMVQYIYFDAALMGATANATLQEPLLCYIVLDASAMLGLAVTYNMIADSFNLQLINALFDAFTRNWGGKYVYTDEIQVIQELGKAKTESGIADIIAEVMATFAWYKAHGDLNDE